MLSCLAVQPGAEPSTAAARPSGRRSIAPRALDLAPALVVAVAFASGAVLSWRRLGSLLIDLGRELEIPRRILAGDVLYRDVRYYWGPLGPHLNAVAYALFGVSTDTLAWAGLAAAGLACAGIFLLSRHVLGRWESAAVAVAFVFLCAFAQHVYVAIFNFVLPFNFNATYGMAAAIWSVHLLLRHEESGRVIPLLGSTFLFGLGALTKSEIVLALAASHGAWLLASRRHPGGAVAAAYGLSLAIAVVGYGAAWLAAGDRLWLDLRGLANAASRAYVAASMGLDDVPAALAEIAISAAALAAAGGLGIAAARFASRPEMPKAARVLALPAAGAVAFVIAAFGLPDKLLRALPLLMAVTIAGLLARRVRRGPQALEGGWAMHVVLWIFGLASLARIALRVGPEHYGFFLLPPGLVCLAVAFFSYGPRLAGGGAWARRALAAAGAGLLAGSTVAALRASVPYFTEPREELVTPRAHLWVDPAGAEGRVVAALSRFPPGTTAIAVPQGAGLLFAAGLATGADGMTSYLPMEIPDDDADARLVAAWEHHPPDLVLYWQQDLGPEFGYRGFGVDYAQRAGRWLGGRYAVGAEAVPGILLLVPAR